jgi:hypothetical protein
MDVEAASRVALLELFIVLLAPVLVPGLVPGLDPGALIAGNLNDCIRPDLVAPELPHDVRSSKPMLPSEPGLSSVDSKPE